MVHAAGIALFGQGREHDTASDCEDGHHDRRPPAQRTVPARSVGGDAVPNRPVVLKAMRHDHARDCGVRRVEDEHWRYKKDRKELCDGNRPPPLRAA
jgi:hypothetical protein